METSLLTPPARPTSNVGRSPLLHEHVPITGDNRTAVGSQEEQNIQRLSTDRDPASRRHTYNGPTFTARLTSRWSNASLESYYTATSYLGSWRTAPSVLSEDETRGDRLALGRTFRKLLQRSGLSPLPEEESGRDEFDWCGRGMHVEFERGEVVPLEVCEPAGHGSTAAVDIVKCRRVKLARKLTHVRPRMLQRDLLKEVQALHRLRHAHIVRLVGTYRKGRVFVALLYPAADMDLAQYLEEAPSMPSLVESQQGLPGSGRKYGLSQGAVCLISALRYVHECGVKHMDIKPANILLKRSDPTRAFYNQTSYKFYLCDFGISQVFNPDDESQTETYPGKTPMYASPEVLMGERHGRASDVFSLGCVLAEMATVYSGMTVEFLKSQLAIRTLPSPAPVDYVHGAYQSVPYCEALDGLRSWVTTLEDMEINKAVILKMLQAAPEDRPSLVLIPREMDGTTASRQEEYTNVIESRCFHDCDPPDAFEVESSDEMDISSSAKSQLAPSRENLPTDCVPKISSPKLMKSSIPYLV